MAEVIASTDGTVVSAGEAILPGFSDPPVAARSDVVYIRDSRDWFYRYSHLKTIEVKPVDRVRLGQKIGLLGKEGSSGGWSHLHFDIHPGDPITFKVRTFQTDPAGETWDFGDGSPPVKVRSDANATPHAPDGYAQTVHRFAKAGHYLIRAEQSGKDGATITARLHIDVEGP